jgi:hypothetical protein
MRAIRRAVISGGAAALLALGATAPAQAHPAKPQITDPRGTQGQAANAVLATIDAGHSALTSARVSITRVGSSASPISVSATPSASMRFPVTLSLNGTYRATVTVGWEDRSVLFPDSGSISSDTHEFKVAAPPAPPGGVATAVDTRTVKVTWEKNGESDMRRYEVLRSRNGGDFAKIGAVDHPDTEYVDATTADAGGDYRYLVVAFRAGVDSNVASQVASDPSALTATSTAKVPDPPPPPTTAPPVTAAAPGAAPGAPAAAPGTATTAPAAGAGSPSGKVDLSGFSNVQAGTPRAVTPRTVPLPDPGFQGTLPFDLPEGEEGEGGEAVEGGDTGELAADSPSFRELGDEESASDSQRSLALFAGGLLATVLLMHVLWVKGEVKRVPLEAVAPEGPPPSASDDAPPRTPRDKATAKAGRGASSDWFVPELGVDDGADRAMATSGADRKAS